jgi:4-hydroxybenzoate polyprenyltransferase
MRLLRVAWRLLRYRVAVMLIVFMLIGAAYGAAIAQLDWRLAVAAAALAVSYISATAINDIIDEPIDAINHPASPGRPLVNKQATRHDLYLLFGLASVVAAALAATLGLRPLGLMLGSILINVLYSAPPFKLSHRTFVVPLILALAYVGIPYLFGAAVIGRRLQPPDVFLVAALYCLFVARINLKDFRDRAGDAAYGKPTLLLRYGKRVTCWVSLAGLLLADILLARVAGSWAFYGLYQLFIGGIVYLLWRLYQAPDHTSEQLAIGVGAKVGNSFLLVLLTQQLGRDFGTPLTVVVVIGFSFALAVGYNVQYLLAHPSQTVNSYRG